MRVVADVLFSLRRFISRRFNHPVEPSYWVMNISIARWRHPTEHDKTRQALKLRNHYGLDDYLLPHWYWARLESFYVLHQLDALSPQPCNFPDEEGKPLVWLDVGSKNGGYFPALCAVARRLHPQFKVVGVEVDAYRFYEDGATRAAYGHGMAQALNPHATFVEADFSEWQQSPGNSKAHVISCFLPFLHTSTHRAWGLPRSLFNPLKQFSAMWNALAPGGLLLISNLNAHEAALQKELIQHWISQEPDSRIHPILEVEALCHPTAFLNTREDSRYLWKLRKPLYAC